jgi:four helix bundle protein
MAKNIKSFTELIVWQKAHQLMLEVYKFSDLLPKEEKYNRVSQLKRRSSSTPSNVAEGFGRYHYQENIQFCRQARGSLEETANHIIAARDLGQAAIPSSNALLEKCDEVRALLNGYIKSLQKSKNHSSNN